MNLGSCIFVMLVLSFFKTIFFVGLLEPPLAGVLTTPICILCMLLVLFFVMCVAFYVCSWFLVSGGRARGGGVKRIFKIMAHFLLG